VADLSTYEGRQAVRDAAAASGQNVTVDASGVYNQNTGQTTNGSEYDSSSPSNPGTPGTPNQPSTYPGVSAADLAKITGGFQASSGMSQKQLDEQMREFDQNLDWQKQMWAQQGLPQLVIQQRAQQLEDDKFAELTREATRSQDWTEEIGRRQATLAEKTQADANTIAQGNLGVAQGNLGVSQSNLGLDTLKTAASLTGPSDWIAAANFNRGVQQSNLPGFMSQLLGGQSTAALGGPLPGAQMPGPNTLSGLASNMGVQGAGNAYVGSQAGMPMVSTGGPMSQQLAAAGLSQNQAGQQYSNMPIGPSGPAAGQAAGLGQDNWQSGQYGAQVGAQRTAQNQNVQQFSNMPVTPANTQFAGGLSQDNWQNGQYGASMAAERGAQNQAMQQFSNMPVTPPMAPSTGAAGDWNTAAYGTPQRTAENQAVQQFSNMPVTPPMANPQWNTAQYGTMGRPAGAQGTANALASGAAAQPTDPSQAEAYLRRLYSRGGAALGPQQMEGLTASEKAMMSGGGASIGADVQGYQDQYNRSRIGQQASMTGMGV
jgi:hypothetical protein